MDAAAVTAPEHLDAGTDGVAAVHIAGSAVWCTARTRRGGQHRVSQTPMDVDPLRYVDDDVVSIGGSEIPTRDAFRGVIRQALSDNGLIERPSLLVLTHPSHWGEVRRGVVYAAARPLAAEVVVVDSAVVAAECADAAGRDTSSVIVVDGCSHRATATAVTGAARQPGPCRLIDGVVSDPESIPLAAQRAVEEIVASARPTLAVLHDSSELLTRRHVGLISKLPVVEVDGADLVTTLLDTEPRTEAEPRTATELRSAPVFDTRMPVATRAPAWLEARTVPKTRKERALDTLASARIGLTAVAAVGVVALAASIWWLGSGTDDTVPAAASSSRADPTFGEGAAGTNADPPATVTAAPSTEPVVPEPNPSLLTLGRVTVTVPDGWHTEPGSERVELLPDVGSGMRILVVSREMGDGFERDDVFTSLQKQMFGTDRGGRFDDLRTDVSVAGRPGLTYVESPTDGSTVAWSVAVSPRLQVSLGCQSMRERRDEMNAVCSTVLDSLAVADA
jgi:type VII secretion-associated protein (TIGR03931 family)